MTVEMRAPYDATIETLQGYGIGTETDARGKMMMIWTEPDLGVRLIAITEIDRASTKEEIAAEMQAITDGRSRIFVDGQGAMPEAVIEAVEAIQMTMPEVAQAVTEAVSPQEGQSAGDALRAVVIRTDKLPMVVSIDGSDGPAGLDALQRIVGGNIEAFDVLFGDDVCLYINEEGAYHCPPNRAIWATKEMQQAGFLSMNDFSRPVDEGEFYTILHGDIIAVGFDWRDGRDRSLTDDEVEAVCRYFTEVSAPGSGKAEAKAIGRERERQKLESYLEDTGVNVSTLFSELLNLVAEEEMRSEQDIRLDMDEETR